MITSAIFILIEQIQTTAILMM